MERSEFEWYHHALEYLIMGAAGGFIVALSQYLGEKYGSIVLIIIAIVYILTAFWLMHKIYSKN